MKIPFYFLILISIAASSCNRQKQNQSLDLRKDNEKLGQYFSAATTGYLSNSADLVYVLKTPLEKLPNQNALDAFIQLEPKVSGTVSVQNNTIIILKPDVPLASNTKYDVVIDLEKLIPELKEKINYSFKTVMQDIAVQYVGTKIGNDKEVSVIWNVQSSDVTTAESVEKCFPSIKKMKVKTITANSFNLEAAYTSASQIPLKIDYNAKPLGIEKTGSLSIPKIDISTFAVHNIFQDEMNQFCQIFFTSPLNPEMDLTGLVTLNNENTQATVTDNIITVFYSDRIRENEAMLYINKGVSSINGNNLQTPYQKSLQIPAITPSVQFVNDGNYFPAQGEFKIPIKTRSLERLRVVVIEILPTNVVNFLAWNSLKSSDYYNLRMFGRPIYDEQVYLQPGIKDKEGWVFHGIDLSERINKSPGAIYHISLEFLPEHTSLPCKSKFKKNPLSTKIPEGDFFDKWDDSYYYYYYDDYAYDYNWNERNDPCNISFYHDLYPVSNLFICSDFGVIAKRAGNEYHAIIHNLLDLKPQSNTTTTLYSLQGEILSTSKTNNEGEVVFEDIIRDASVLSISNGKHATYLPLNPAESISLSDFDVEGDRLPTQTMFFTYTERNVWRPGDSIFVNLMVNASEVLLPNGIPIQMSFSNPENQVLREETRVLDLSKNQIYAFALATQSDDKTGIYRCKFKIGTQTIYHNIRVETIKPNTTELVFNYDNLVKGVIHSDNITGNAHLKYLTGFEVPNAKVFIEGRAVPIYKPFEEFGLYNFESSSVEFENNFTISEGVTDSKGNLTFKAVPQLKKLNSPAKIYLESEITMSDGGVNKQGNMIIASPFESYIGAKRTIGSGWSGNYLFSENIQIDLVRLDRGGNLINNRSEIKYEIYQHTQSWWIDKYSLKSNGTFRESAYWKFKEKSTANINGKGKITIAKNHLPKGAYKLVIMDTKSEHTVTEYFTVYDGKTSIPKDQPHYVSLETDKNLYSLKDKINLKLPNIKNAKVLISIERANKIIEKKWVDLGSDQPLTLSPQETWIPNVYINASIVQPYNQTDNDLPLRMIGVHHIKIDDESFALKPMLDTPPQAQSNSSLEIKVSESSGKQMEYTLAIVDEGLLGITGFTTPNPLRHFKGRYPLLVKTWDIYQNLMMYFKGKFAGIISIGGDDAYRPDVIPEVSRFKPVVRHFGPYKLAKGETKKHVVKLPNYQGKVRVMVVGCSGNQYGNVEKNIVVKNPLMIQAQLPRSLNVTDQISIPVTIMKDEKSISEVTLSMTSTPDILGKINPATISLASVNQKIHAFNIKVPNNPTNINLNISATGNGKKVNETSEITINYPNTFATKSREIVIDPGKTEDFNIKPIGYSKYYTSTISVGGYPTPNFAKYASELLEYPYGCLEQLTSSLFAQLYGGVLFELDRENSTARNNNLEVGLNRIGRLQKADGRFSYWENGYYHPWSDLYTGLLLIEARKINHQHPNLSTMINNFMKYHGNIANNWSLNNASTDQVYESESLIQAFRMYLLAMSGEAPKSALNRFASSNGSKNPLVWWLIGGTYNIIGFENKSNEFVAKAESLLPLDDYYYAHSLGTSTRDLAIIVAILSEIKMRDKSKRYYQELITTANKKYWLSTQEKGFVIYAANKFLKGQNIKQEFSYNIKDDKGSKTQNHNSFTTLSYTYRSDSKAVSIKNLGKNPIFVQINERYLDNEVAINEGSNGIQLKTFYFNASKGADGLSNAQLGDEYIISLEVENTTVFNMDDVVLNFRTPSGWELINPNIYETKGANYGDNFTYQDYRDDRVHTFFGLGPKGKKVFRFKAICAFAGDFYLPSIVCERMYDGNTYARTSSGRISITK